MNGNVRTSVFLGFTALAITVSLSGCIVDATPNNNTTTCADQRYVTADWTIVKNVNNAPLSCDQAAASTVVMDFGTYTWSWSCFDGSNTSPFSGIPEGGYTTQLQLLGPNNEILSTTPAATYQMAHCAPTVVSVDFGVN